MGPWELDAPEEAVPRWVWAIRMRVARNAEYEARQSTVTNVSGR